MTIWELYIDNYDGDISCGLFSTEEKAKAKKQRLIEDDMKVHGFDYVWCDQHYRIRAREVDADDD